MLAEPVQEDASSDSGMQVAWTLALILCGSLCLFYASTATLPVTAMALLGVAIAFHVGRTTSGIWGGCGSALFLALLPLYQDSASSISADLPATALVLAALAAYVRLRSRDDPELVWFLLASAFGSLAFLLRPACGAALVPVLRCALARPELRRKVACAAVAAIPLLAAAVVQAVWIGIPAGVRRPPGDSVDASLSLLLDSHLATLAVVVLVFTLLTKLRRSLGLARAVLEFTAVCGAPMLAFQLRHADASARSTLPLFAMLLVLLGSLAGIWLERARKPFLSALLVFFVAGAAASRLYFSGFLPAHFLQSSSKEAGVQPPTSLKSLR